MRIAHLGHLALIIGFLSCGGDSDDDVDACEPVEPCGGDVVGRWRLEASCTNQALFADSFESALPEACRGSFGSIDIEPIDATIEFTADGVLNGAGSARSSLTYTFSEACLAALGTPGSEARCIELAESNLSEEDGMVTSTCTFSNGGCDCVQSGTGDASASIAYTLDGDRLVSGDSTSPYCVAGDRLTYGDLMFGQTVATRLAD